MSVRAGTFAPRIGLSGTPIPFTTLVDANPEPSAGPDPSTGAPVATFLLRPSPWLAGLSERGLPAPQVIVADVAAGAAALLDRAGGYRVMTESLRLDPLGEAGPRLRATAHASVAHGPRALTVGVVASLPDATADGNGAERTGANGAPPVSGGAGGAEAGSAGPGDGGDAQAGTVAGHLSARILVLDPRQAGGRVDAPSRVPTGHTPAVEDLLGDATTLEHADADVVRLRVPAHGDVGNSYGFMHGGAVAVYTDIGLEWLRGRPAPDLAGSRVLSVTLDYLAPVRLRGAVGVTSRIVERGGGRAIVAVTVAGDGDAACAIASYTVRLRRR
ncbi:hypothetical protein FRACA_1130022 [Frankia canadensis]|uniref:Thioesterase domain-containing protein n=1 Tax=Frankia canadensis TaxID=1836972 RepID=A0A2I2KJK0_9ACTN|nr:hotdog fold domain-containing protein [Frankia canadensis]SNQ45827.1 hypothetical protein FRACA_1130022 [Frankia canadensis]SOU53117.1 hypothetical protein FRACA_1130022 [Frankia canadensis]